MEHRNNVNFSLFKQLAKVNNNKINKKRSQEQQSMDPKYVTEQINSCVLELHLRQFCRLTVLTILICFSLIKRFHNDCND